MNKIDNAHTDFYQIKKDNLSPGKELLTNQVLNENFMDIVARRKELAGEIVKSGETEVSTPMGGDTFTDKQWDKMMKSVDLAIQDMRDRIREQERYRQRRDKKKRENAKRLKNLRFRIKEQIIHTEITSHYYSVEVGRNGTFVVSNKVTGHRYTFIETQCRVQKDQVSGKIFLVSTQADEVYEKIGCIEVDEVLESMLREFLEFEDLETEELTIKEAP